MMNNRNLFSAAALSIVFSASVFAEPFNLVTGVDSRLSPGTPRPIFPDPGPSQAPGTFVDGDRLAGTSDTGPPVAYAGTGTPVFDPNEFGSLSFTFRRGSVAAGPNIIIPIMGIDYLGGPLLDFDGDAGNGSRSLVPAGGITTLPGTDSSIDINPNFGSGTIQLLSADMTGNSEGSDSFGPEIAVTVNVLAGTATDGTPGSPINGGVDTRSGSLAAFTGTGSLQGVYEINNLGYEMWQDSALDGPNGPFLGTFQYLGQLSGWLITREVGGSFPTLAGQGLGTTAWPAVNVSEVGNTFNAAHGAPTATISGGTASDDFTVAGNGGLPLTDNSGDLGAYLDNVVIPALAADVTSFVYLESAGFGINNSFDPVFGDTVSYDLVIVAGSDCIVTPGGNGDGDGDGINDVCQSDPMAVPAASTWSMIAMVCCLFVIAGLRMRRMQMT